MKLPLSPSVRIYEFRIGLKCHREYHQLDKERHGMALVRNRMDGITWRNENNIIVTPKFCELSDKTSAKFMCLNSSTTANALCYYVYIISGCAAANTTTTNINEAVYALCLPLQYRTLQRFIYTKATRFHHSHIVPLHIFTETPYSSLLFHNGFIRIKLESERIST